MFPEISDSTAEAGLEGGSQLMDNAVQLVEDFSGSNSIWQNAQPSLLSDAFPQASVGGSSIDFSPASSSMDFNVSDTVGSMPDLGQQFSSLIQNALQLPGPLGFLSAIFQFFSALFSSLINAVMNPNFMAQLAQSAMDMKKMMLSTQ